MKYLIISLLVSSFFHGGHLAVYDFDIQDESIDLKFTIEKEDLLHFNWNEDCDLENMTAFCVSNYLKEHVLLELNEQKVDFELEGSYTDHGHYVVKMNAKKENKTIEKLTLKIDAFLEQDAHFKNRGRIKMNGKTKSYLLTKKKDRIEI
jgi:hypothetical protein